MKIRLVTANIGRNVNAAQVRADMRALRRLPNAIIGFQEIDEGDPADEHRILRQVFRKRQFAGFARRVPIVVSNGLNVQRRKVTKAAEGIPRVSPARVITEVVVAPRNPFWRKRIPPFVVLNMHYPAGAFNARIEPTQAIRESRWADMFKVHQERVKFWADKGYTVFWVGDVNRMNMPKTHPRERQLETRGIDYICVVEGNVRVQVKRRRVRKSHSDHNAKWLVLKLTRA